MKFILFQAGLICLVLNVAWAQGTVSGTITDSRNVPLSDVSIFIEALHKRTVSDKIGRFVLRNIPSGTYDLSVSSVGFKSQQQPVTVNNGQTTPVQVKLEQGELVLADVVITDQFSREVNTISQVDIKLRPVNTSQDILRMIPGLFIAQHAGGGKAEQIFLRGFDIDHGTDINLEVDGLPVNMVSHAHGQGYSDLHFLIPEIVGTVDFNKGPYYADKGNFTTAGYASFQTKNALEQNMIKVEGGRFGTFRNVNAINVLNTQNGDWRSNAYVASEYFRTDGFFESDQHFNRLNLVGKCNAYRGDKEALTIGLSTFNSRWDASGQIPTRAVDDGSITRFGSIDPTEGGETSRSNAWIRYINTSLNGGIFENQLYFSKYDFNLVSNFTFFLNDPVNGDQITQSESRNIYGYKGSYVIESNPGNKNLRSEVGAGFRYDDVNNIHLYHTRSRKQFINDVARGDLDETNLYAFVNETLFINDRLSLNAAVRLDHFTFNYVDALTPDYARQSVSKAMVSPKLNISYHASQRVNLFVKSGIGFHSNDTRVVVAQRGEEILPKAYGLDAGANFKLGDKLLLSTALWMLDLDQEFVYVGDEGVVEPSGKTRRKGIDLSLRYQALPWLYIDSDVNITDPKAKGAPEGEDHIPLAPTLTSIGGLSVKLRNGLNASLRYRYLGDRPANEDNSVVAQGYFLLDAVVKYTRKSYELSFSAENLLNEAWNEAQFDTESRLQNEVDPVSEIHFTPGTPFFFKVGMSFFF
ncbi:carboxypeptidase-like regulatory domain-containing protein [Fulvivirgaceae bacterium PWU4]|uniref:Carboxypeptidase-like regulatory domain-containing protein n=1 Tax=Chryseosolibacter histidini TaxID=2782349 RepID=A0AAP2DNM9_9BACT|nr:TonB-dependent receptor [Chryseosolibacter histidini]MBT1698417.1 carboxypeptidase-like regulatory domain-containing protein [Chryseosolibacter histidini]